MKSNAISLYHRLDAFRTMCHEIYDSIEEEMKGDLKTDKTEPRKIGQKLGVLGCLTLCIAHIDEALTCKDFGLDLNARGDSGSMSATLFFHTLQRNIDQRMKMTESIAEVLFEAEKAYSIKPDKAIESGILRGAEIFHEHIIDELSIDYEEFIDDEVEAIPPAPAPRFLM